MTRAKQKLSTKKHRTLISPTAQRTLRRALLRLREDHPRTSGTAVGELAACLAIRGGDCFITIASADAARTVRADVARASSLARALKAAFAAVAARKKRVAVLGCGDLSAGPALADALHRAAAQRLPILFLTASGRLHRRTPQDLHALATSCGVPVLTVDACDAVAAFRVATEAAHNARLGRGPTLLNLVQLPARHALPSPDPLAALEAYMRRHGTLK